MKTLLDDYQDKLKNINECIDNNTNNGSIGDIKRATRLSTKASEYRAFIVDIERAIARSSDGNAISSKLMVESVILNNELKLKKFWKLEMKIGTHNSYSEKYEQEPDSIEISDFINTVYKLYGWYKSEIVVSTFWKIVNE